MQPTSPQALMKQMVCASWLTQAIYVAAELSIADLLANGSAVRKIWWSTS